jgi:hypothetical protein
MRMSSSRIGFRWVRPLIGALALGLALVFGSAPAIAAGAHTSPEDRARFVSITHKLEETPLLPGLQADRAWALQWLIDAPDVGVSVCPSMLGGLDQNGYPYASQIVLQYTFSMGAFVIEHPESANDLNAQQLAGVAGALKAYRSILRDKPDAKSPALDALLETEARGGLPDFVRKASAHCSAKT